MKRFISLLFLFTIYSYASLIGSSYSQNNLQVLEDLDIKPTFMTDYKLQEMYAFYQKSRNSEHYVKKLNEASLFVPKIKDILRQEGIPDVFIYMAMAESYFAVDARSNVKATGIWQFMYETAQRYDLQYNMYVDERMDLIKSTQAATKYLNYLHDRFGKWYLAAIAYNCGEGRVIEGITRARIDLYVQKYPKAKRSKKIREYRRDIRNYQQKRAKFSTLKKIYDETKEWGIEPDIEELLMTQTVVSRQYIPTESRRYIRKIISFAMMNSNNFIISDENSHLLNMGISTTVATVPVKGGLHLRSIAKSIGMSYEDLHNLNKHIKQSIIPPYQKTYTINIPYNRLAIYNKNKDSIKNTKFTVYIVRSGDTLYDISRKYKIPYKILRDYNNLKTTRLSIKQRLVLPIPDERIRKVSKNIKSTDYLVKSGDSLSRIAKMYNTKVKKLMKDNNLTTTALRIGDRLVIR